MRLRVLSFFVLIALVASFAFLGAPPLDAQSVQGAVSITVTDPANAVIPSAKLELKATDTNDLRTGVSQESGTYRFVGLNLGRYSLTVTKEGFSRAVVDPIVVEAARVTDVAVQLKLGATTSTVEVTTAADPVLEMSSNMIASTIDVQQIENLPISGRDITAFARLAPGYNGTWDGAPAFAQGNNIDGVISSSSRMKFSGNSQPSVSPRIENIEEMTVQTDQLDMDQGFGASIIQLNFITRSGTNSYHGRLYEDFRNKDLNANRWDNNGRGIPRAPFILNNFGGSVGGPFLKNKLFFFGSFSMSKQPGSITANNTVLSSAAQAGNFGYIGSDGATHTVNVLNLVNGFNSSLPHTINPIIAAEQANINNSLTGGVITPNSDPNTASINWLVSSPVTNYYPTGRLDYNPTNSLRLHATMNMSQSIQPTSGTPQFPGQYFASQAAGFKSIYATYSVGADWTIKPTVVNQFKIGYLYNPVWNPLYTGAPLWLTGNGAVGWALGNSGVSYTLPISNFYPNFTLSDSVAWQKGSHQFKFGFTAWQEHDKYWNAPQGFPNYSLGLVTGDPALGPFTLSAFPGANSSQLNEAEQLYATLVGRISSVGGQFGVDPKTKQYNQTPGSDYNLNELLRSGGVFAQDSWHVNANLTVNLGLRWDFVGDNYDLSGAYHNAQPQDVYGPSGVGMLFRPGVLNGDFNPNITARPHAYNGWKVTPQPQVGLAWKPSFKEGILGKTLADKTVIRTGFSLKKYTEPQQYFWNQATNYGSAYFQQFFLNPNGNNGIAGSFAPGALNLGDPLPAYGYAPAGAYQTTIPLAPYTFNQLDTIGTIVNGINPHIKQPYTMSWNFGIQRELGQSRVLEVRYNGNRSVHQWLSGDINEVNIFNGFLTDFTNAQNNLNINAQHGVNNSFANMGFAGQAGMPILDAAFAGEKVTNGALQDYSNSSFITWLKTGQAGRLANTLSGISGTAPYFCNMVGAAFTPCATNAGYTGKGAGYPINFWQANPYSAGAPVQYMDSIGFSDYHALQIDLRQRTWHGLEFDANYTWSHTLGLATPNDWEAANPTIYTMRDLRLSYGPTLYDLRHVVHASVTGELPFGKGRRFMNHGGILNEVLGGWNIGNILTFQTGAPVRIATQSGSSQVRTLNDYADAGVILNGITAADLQSAVGVYHVGAARGGYVDLIDPKFLTAAAGGTANPAYITPNNTPGALGQIFYLHGPHQTFNDTSISKIFPITERVRFSFQSEFLNIFNHPTFGNFNGSILSTSFGHGSISPNSPRNIEFRGNIIF
ncbi:MAG TPA: carboxypeptidase regulatory-like domain-containing protein [Bryobacteraceae bacterium]|nr:carboxypeptidase regulatory-like domain-containing protein [Bryobacteraceae bacterium]